jgi:hypothetical protein
MYVEVHDQVGLMAGNETALILKINKTKVK